MFIRPAYVLRLGESGGLQEGELLVVAVDDGDGVQFQPPVEDGGVGGAEVVGEVEVAFGMVLGTQGRVLAVEAAVDRAADNEGHAAGAVVSAGAVVLDAPAELGEDEDQRVVGQPVLLQVAGEVGDGGGHVGPQLGVSQ